LQEMQLVVLKYREELITVKVGQEHSDELLKSEIMFLRDQIVAEQQERSTMEENLAQEISQLQQQLGNYSRQQQQPQHHNSPKTTLQFEHFRHP